jgi:hypothetical protein
MFAKQGPSRVPSSWCKWSQMHSIATFMPNHFQLPFVEMKIFANSIALKISMT